MRIHVSREQRTSRTSRISRTSRTLTTHWNFVGQVVQRVLQVCSSSASLPFLDLNFRCPTLTSDTFNSTTTSTSTSTTQQTSLDPPPSSCCSSSVTFSLLSACWACQWNQPLKDRVVTTFKVYQAQCAPNTVRISSFDAAVQLRLDNAGIAVPPWAAIRPDPDALWFVFHLISSYLLLDPFLNLKSKPKAKAPACTQTGTNMPLKSTRL